MCARPTITTPRLVLRPYVADDAAELARLAGARAIAATTINIPHPYAVEDAVAWIDTHEALAERGTAYLLAITDAASGALCGGIGLTVHLAHERAELGYWTAEPAWGRGYATEAALAVVSFGFDELNLHRIDAHHFAANPASGRVLEKIGMQREGTFDDYIIKWGERHSIVFYRLLRAEFDAQFGGDDAP